MLGAISNHQSKLRTTSWWFFFFATLQTGDRNICHVRESNSCSAIIPMLHCVISASRKIQLNIHVRLPLQPVWQALKGERGIWERESAWSRSLIPFPFRFERLPRRLPPLVIDLLPQATADPKPPVNALWLEPLVKKPSLVSDRVHYLRWRFYYFRFF